MLTEKADDKVTCIYSNLLLATTKQNTTDNFVCECNEPNQHKMPREFGWGLFTAGIEDT